MVSRWFEVRWVGIASWLLFYFFKQKTVSSNERKDIGRGAEVWEAKERSRTRKRKEKETEKGKLKLKKKENICETFFPSNLMRVI